MRDWDPTEDPQAERDMRLEAWLIGALMVLGVAAAIFG